MKSRWSIKKTCSRIARWRFRNKVRHRQNLRILELPRSSIVQEYLKQVILNNNSSNSRIRTRQLGPHPWCYSVSPLPLSVKSDLKSAHCQIWDLHVQSQNEQVGIMFSLKKQKQKSHRWHHSVSRLPLIINSCLKDRNVKCIAAA